MRNAKISVNQVDSVLSQTDTYIVNVSGQSSATASQGVLINDYDYNSPPNFAAQLYTGPSHGSLTLNNDGSFTYTPNGTFQGVDRFQYLAHDGTEYGNPTTVTIYSHGGALVTKIYEEMVGYVPTDAQIASWAPGVDNGSYTMANVEQGIYNSSEYLNAKVSTLFQEFLGRAPSSSDLSYWDGVWTSYESPEQVIIGIAVTDEAFAHAGGTNYAWVDSLYLNILNRNPDPNGINYWVNELNNGLVTRQYVVQSFVTGSEYRSDVIQSFFQLFLNRSASSSDVNYFEQLFADGYSQMQIQQILVTSGEYTSNPPGVSAGSVYKWV